MSAKKFLGIEGPDNDDLELNVYLSKVVKWMEDYHQHMLEQQPKVNDKEFVNNCMDAIQSEVRKHIADPGSVSVSGKIFEKLLPYIQSHDPQSQPEVGESWNANVYDELMVVEIITIQDGEVFEVMNDLTRNQYFNKKDSDIHQFDLLSKVQYPHNKTE